MGQQAEAEAGSLFREAEKLSRGKAGHATAAQPGHIALTGGRWRKQELHEKILELYRRSDELFPGQGFALYRLALEKLYSRDLDGAAALQQQLAERQSSYAGPYLPIWIAVARGDKQAAKAHLEVLNAENKAKGRPRNSLSDFML